tara:strand:+ start:577 stop:708 length:132 start_codon:yes stop_codon:yes gene_type:complete
MDVLIKLGISKYRLTEAIPEKTAKNSRKVEQYNTKIKGYKTPK